VSSPSPETTESGWAVAESGLSAWRERRNKAAKGCCMSLDEWAIDAIAGADVAVYTRRRDSVVAAGQDSRMARLDLCSLASISWQRPKRCHHLAVRADIAQLPSVMVVLMKRHTSACCKDRHPPW